MDPKTHSCIYLLKKNFKNKLWSKKLTKQAAFTVLHPPFFFFFAFFLGFNIFLKENNQGEKFSCQVHLVINWLITPDKKPASYINLLSSSLCASQKDSPGSLFLCHSCRDLICVQSFKLSFERFKKPESRQLSTLQAELSLWFHYTSDTFIK